MKPKQIIKGHSVSLDFTEVLGNFDPEGNIDLDNIPAKYEVCNSCYGTGTTTRHVEMDGGGFTASEWAEQDDEFKEDYLNGVYDRPCPECKGQRVVAEVNEEACSKEFLDIYHKYLEEERRFRMEEAAERRWGC